MYPDENNAAGASLLQQLHIAVIRLDSKMDGIIDRLTKLEQGLEKQLADHEARIRAIETRPYVAPNTVWKVVGTLLTLLGLAVGVIGLILR